MRDDITSRYHGGNPESMAAKERSQEKSEQDRQRIMRLALTRGPYGLTCDEAEVLLGLKHQSCSARFSEMKRDGVLIASDVVRLTRSGSKARVMVLSGDLRSNS